MKKKFSLISKVWDGKSQNLFIEGLKDDYLVQNFEWEEVYGEKFDYLKDSDIVYLKSLGEIEGRTSELLHLFENMKNLEAIVINDPETMIENFNKEYLLFLQSKGIPVIPTKEVSNLDYQQINGFNFDGYSNVLIKPKVFGERMKGIFKLEDSFFTEKSLKKYKKEYGNLILAQPFILDITKYGERSLVFVGDNFSHAVYRHRKTWNTNNPGKEPIISQVEPKKSELKISEDILSVWPTKYHITRFDFITNKDKPLISEVEMINPNLWLCNGLEGIDSRFIKIFKNYLKTLY